MHNLFQEIIKQTSNFIENKCNGCCLSLIDKHGNQILFFKFGEPTPCSINFSYQKAFTSYSFQQNNDDVYRLMTLSASQSLFDSKFCFIPGGIICSNKNNENYFLGVSTDIPDLDKKIALKIANLIGEQNK